jgi:hypothetical protein
MIKEETVENLIDWKNAIKLDLTRNASPVFDVTNKVYKQYESSIYFYDCDDDEFITLKKLSL